MTGPKQPGVIIPDLASRLFPGWSTFFFLSLFFSWLFYVLMLKEFFFCLSTSFISVPQNQMESYDDVSFNSWAGYVHCNAHCWRSLSQCDCKWWWLRYFHFWLPSNLISFTFDRRFRSWKFYAWTKWTHTSLYGLLLTALLDSQHFLKWWFMNAIIINFSLLLLLLLFV